VNNMVDVRKDLGARGRREDKLSANWEKLATSMGMEPRPCVLGL